MIRRLTCCLALLVPITAAAEPTSPPPATNPSMSQAMTNDRMKNAITSPGAPSAKTPSSVSQVQFSALPGWENDDHLAAWKAFLASCGPVIDAGKAPVNLLEACHIARLTQASGRPQTRASAKTFFERYFAPHAVKPHTSNKLLTGYYEPLVEGSRTKTGAFQTPVYRRPTDLVNIVAESERGATKEPYTHVRKTAAGTQPYPTRAEIEQGALAGHGLELLYFRDPVDVYFMQIQGSARIALTDGTTVRITYDGKNGHPYTSIGRSLIEANAFTPEGMSLQALSKWLKADRERAQPIMWKNESYVFFRELTGAEAQSAMGVMKIPLTPGRSLAVDTAFHAIGTPIYVASDELTHASSKSAPFQRLMIAQDVGSAIKGVERGDIFFGSGPDAGRKAGVTKHPSTFYVLLARDAPAP